MTDRTTNPTKARPLPKYQILTQLGQGGMGDVHLAMSRGPSGFVKLVVLKSLKAGLRDDASTYRMFLEEARISARLTHANLVQTYEIIEFNGTPTMVLEYVEGQTLRSILSQSAYHFDRDMHLTILTKVLTGLHAAHELCDFDGTPLGLVHRDVSPHNVMLQFDGQVRLLDFGIARTVRSKTPVESGVLRGKLRYMAPEQLQGGAVDFRVDLFAVGIMLWEALAQTRIWGDLSDDEIAYQLLSDAIPRLPDTSEIPNELSSICYRAIAADPAKRYASAGEFLRALESYLAARGTLSSAEQLGRYLEIQFAAERRETRRVINAHIQAIGDSVNPPRQVRLSDATEVAVSRNQPNAPVDAPVRSTHRLPSLGALTLASIVGLVSGGGWWLKHSLARSPGESTQLGAALSEPTDTRCSPPSKACAGDCVTLDHPEFGCGSANCQYCQTSNAMPRCNQRNECDIAVCHQAYDDCDRDPRNGCETNVRTDPNHCGGCGKRCPDLPHAVRGCGDACTIWRCENGYRDCNGEVSDGCEIQVADDSHNCGHCGIVCPRNSRCQQGKCRP